MIPLRHLKKISNLSPTEFEYLIKLACNLKNNEKSFRGALKAKTLLMLFSKPSLRTRVSFETIMTKLGGHAIYYSITDSPLGKKESYSDTAKVLSRYADVVMARVPSRVDINSLAKHSTIPIINALDDFAHPCQMLADFQTIYELFGRLSGLKMAYVGDTHNNVTYDLMRSCCMLRMEIRVSGPNTPMFKIEKEVLEECEKLTKLYGGRVIVTHDPVEAVKDVDIVYNDSWCSYHIPEAEMAKRLEELRPYQVNAELMKHASPNSIFLNCLPALRGMEITADVIDGPQSHVFQEAENRMWAQGALLLWLLGKTEPKKK